MTYKYEIESRGHDWKREEDGSVDVFGYDGGTHNGPVCTACGYGFCHHCQELPSCDCDAIIDIIAVDIPAKLPAGIQAG